MRDFLARQFQFLKGRVAGGVDAKTYPRTQDLGRWVPQVTMPRAPRMQIPGGTNLVDLFYLAGSLIRTYTPPLK